MARQSQDSGSVPVQRLLKIWQRRVSMAERGVTNPRPALIPHMRQLVAGLSALDPAAAVRLERHGNTMWFIAAETEAIIHSIPLFGPPSDDDHFNAHG